MSTYKKSTARSKGNWQGMNWITQKKRLAIYLRDGVACAYCGEGVEEGAILSLDHLKPHSKGGSNHETNLVTCCKACNDSRGNKPLRTFLRQVGQAIGWSVQDLEKSVRNTAKRVLPLAEAKEMIQRRGSAKKAIQG